MFLELLDEEAAITRGAPRIFDTFDGLTKMLDARAALIKKIEMAKNDGQVTEQQHDQLIALVRKHARPPASS